MAHPSAARTLNAVQAWRAQAQRALVVAAVGFQAGRRGAVFADRVNSHELPLLFLERGWSGAAAPPRPGVTHQAASRVVSVPAGAAGVPSFFQASQRRYSGEPTYSRLSTPIFRW